MADSLTWPLCKPRPRAKHGQSWTHASILGQSWANMGKLGHCGGARSNQMVPAAPRRQIQLHVWRAIRSAPGPPIAMLTGPLSFHVPGTALHCTAHPIPSHERTCRQRSSDESPSTESREPTLAGCGPLPHEPHQIDVDRIAGCVAVWQCGCVGVKNTEVVQHSHYSSMK